LPRIKLYEIAHSRAGDKGEITNISLIPYDSKHYQLLKEQVTAAVVKEHFGQIASGKVVRYDLDILQAFNFVLYETRPGGVSSGLDFDAHGKALSWALLEMEIDVPQA
jgi:hypothetical protein